MAMSMNGARKKQSMKKMNMQENQQNEGVSMDAAAMPEMMKMMKEMYKMCEAMCKKMGIPTNDEE